MKNNFVRFTKKMLVRLFLAVPLGIAINAFAFTPNTVKAAPCLYCDESNFCEFVADYGGGHSCVDSGDGSWCNATSDCPLM